MSAWQCLLHSKLPWQLPVCVCFRTQRRRLRGNGMTLSLIDSRILFLPSSAFLRHPYYWDLFFLIRLIFPHPNCVQIDFCVEGGNKKCGVDEGRGKCEVTGLGPDGFQCYCKYTYGGMFCDQIQVYIFSLLSYSNLVLSNTTMLVEWNTTPSSSSTKYLISLANNLYDIYQLSIYRLPFWFPLSKQSQLINLHPALHPQSMWEWWILCSVRRGGVVWMSWRLRRSSLRGTKSRFSISTIIKNTWTMQIDS